MNLLRLFGHVVAAISLLGVSACSSPEAAAGSGGSMNGGAGGGNNAGGGSGGKGGNPGAGGSTGGGGSGGASVAGSTSSGGTAGNGGSASGGSGGTGVEVFSQCRFHFGAFDEPAREDPALAAEIDYFIPGWMGTNGDTFDQ